MSDEMKPALTADEWRDFLDPANKEWAPLAYHNLSDHAAAATGLFGRPFGFTKEDVRGLRMVAAAHPAFGPPLDELAERIAALLPPEP